MGDSTLQDRLNALREKEHTLKLQKQVQQKERSVRTLEREINPSKKRRLFNVSKKIGRAGVGYLEAKGRENIRQPRAPRKKKKKKAGQSYGLGLSDWGF